MPQDSNFISIIIATYNVGHLIEKTLLSIYNQTYQNFEIIVIDGTSDVDTISYIEKHKSRLTYYVSEPDEGIYDAWNKGLIHAKGRWIAFLGAGDEYLPEALHGYISLLSSLPNDIEFISSKVAITNAEGDIMYVRGKPWCWPQFLSSMTCAHVGALHSRTLFEKYGSFDTTYKIAGDYEFLMRIRNQLNAVFLPMITVHMLNGGISTSSAILLEDRKLKINTGKKPIWKANFEFIKNYSKRLMRVMYEFFTKKTSISLRK